MILQVRLEKVIILEIIME